MTGETCDVFIHLSAKEEEEEEEEEERKEENVISLSVCTVELELELCVLDESTEKRRIQCKQPKRI